MQSFCSRWFATSEADVPDTNEATDGLVPVVIGTSRANRRPLRNVTNEANDGRSAGMARGPLAPRRPAGFGPGRPGGPGARRGLRGVGRALPRSSGVVRRCWGTCMKKPANSSGGPGRGGPAAASCLHRRSSRKWVVHEQDGHPLRRRSVANGD